MSAESSVHKREVMTESINDFDKAKESNEPSDVEHKTGEEFKTPTKYNKTFILLCTHLNAVLYSVCFWIQIGVLPYLSKKLGADPVMFGYLQTTFAVVQLCGGPIYGRFGDLFGSRAALSLAFFAAAISYGILSMSTSVTMLFLSRLPSIVMHVMQGSQMTVTDVSEESERSNALGKLGVSYAIGMVIGPFLGGILSKLYGLQFAAMCSCAISLASAVMVTMLLPKNTKALFHKTSHSDAPRSSSSVFDFKKISELVKIPSVLYLLLLKICTAIPFGIFQSMFAIVSMEYFKLDPQHNGFVLSYAGTLSILVQGIGVGYVTKRFNETDLLKWSVASIAVAYALMFMVTDIYQFCAVLVPLVTGGTILTIITTAALTKAVDIKDTGVVLGLSMACNSFVRSLSPMLGGFLFKMYGWPVFGGFGFVVNAVIVLFLMIYGKKSL